MSQNRLRPSSLDQANWAARVVLILLFSFAGAPQTVRAQHVVSNGAFTNVYVLPDPDKETWEQHIAKLRPTDADQFSRAKIDEFTEEMMAHGWPSYFDPLLQYAVQLPQFFGSGQASQSCVDAAIKDELQGILQWDTIRSLANCHQSGMDPSPQVNLIFSPDFKIAKICVLCTYKTDMCRSSEWAWHASGLNMPDFVALPTSEVCAKGFQNLTQHLSHEVVETISDPAGMGVNFGTRGPFGIPLATPVEAADKCENTSNAYTNPNTLNTGAMEWSLFSLARYWSVDENNCLPQLDPPSGAVAATWVLGQGSPLQTLKPGHQVLNLKMPDDRANTDAQLSRAVIVIQSGSNYVWGSSNEISSVDVTLTYAGGSTTTHNINAQYRSGGPGDTHAAELVLPNPAPHANEITGLSISLVPGSKGLVQTWDINKVALLVSFPSSSKVTVPPLPVVDNWVDVSGIPLVRFTGDVHDFTANADTHHKGKVARALNLVISTGNDDLRGGSNPGDNCDVIVDLGTGKPITLSNINHGQSWAGWTINTVPVPLPAGGLKAGDVKWIRLHTGFGGGSGGDNWNVERVQLQATLAEVDKISPDKGPAKGGTTVTIIGKGLQGATKVKFGDVEATHVESISDSKLTADSPPATVDQAKIEVETSVGEIANSGENVFSYVPEVTGITPDSGPFFGGSTVTLEGRALSGKYKFTFGGAPATGVNCSHSDKCTMITPSHDPGKVELKVEAPAGDSSITDAFDYLPPAIKSFDPAVGPTTGGLSVMLAGTSLQTGMTVKFGDAETTATGCSDPTSCGLTSPAHVEGSVQLTATVNGVTSAPSAGDFTFKVFPTISGVLPNSVPPNPSALPVNVNLKLTGTGFSTTAGATVFNLGPSMALKDVSCATDTVCTAVFINGPVNPATSTTETLPVTVTVNGLTSLGAVKFTYPIQHVAPTIPPTR